MTERWLPIADYEGLYEVSDHGQVRSLDRVIWRQSRSGNAYPWTRPGRILRQYRVAHSLKSYRRYWQVQLVDTNGIQHHHYVHLLVARAFLGPCGEGQQVRHGPAGYLVNRRTNLSYGTPTENQADRRRDGTDNAGSRNPAAKLTESQVRAIRLRCGAGERQKDLAAEFGVSNATVSMVVSGQRWAGTPNTI